MLSDPKKDAKRRRKTAQTIGAREHGFRVAQSTKGYVTLERPARGEAIGRAIDQARDPSRAPSAVRSSEALRAEIAAREGVAVAPARQCVIEGCVEAPGAGYTICRTHGRRYYELRRAATRRKR